MMRSLLFLLTLTSAQAFTTSPICFSTRPTSIAFREEVTTTTSLNLFNFFSKEAQAEREAAAKKRKDEEEAALLEIRARRRDPDKMSQYFNEVVESRKELNKKIEAEKAQEQAGI